jgi:hypothetical protein
MKLKYGEFTMGGKKRMLFVRGFVRFFLALPACTVNGQAEEEGLWSECLSIAVICHVMIT